MKSVKLICALIILLIAGSAMAWEFPKIKRPGTDSPKQDQQSAPAAGSSEIAPLSGSAPSSGVEVDKTVAIMDFILSQPGEGSSVYAVPFNISGQTQNFKKGKAQGKFEPAFYFAIRGSYETDDQILFTITDAAGKSLGTEQKSAKQADMNVTTVTSVTITKPGRYGAKIELVNAGAGKRVVLKNVKFLVEEIQVGEWTYMLVNEDCHLREGWLVESKQGKNALVIFYVKARGKSFTPVIRLFYKGQQVGEAKELETPSSQRYGAQLTKGWTGVKWQDIISKDGNWEARVTVNGEAARKFTFNVDGGQIVRNPEQLPDMSFAKGSVITSRLNHYFLLGEVIPNKTEPPANPDMLKLQNMFFGRKPIAQ